jgi:hypothetical protein
MAESDVQETANKMAKWWEATKTMLLPFGIVVGVLGLVIWFAADAWVRGIANEEIAKGAGAGAATTVDVHETRLTKVEGDVEDQGEDIDENEDDIKTVEKSVREFMRDLIDRL